MKGKRMPEAQHWVNAVIELVVPLDVGVDASADEKGEAVAQAMERLAPDDQNVVVSARWEDIFERDGATARRSPEAA